MPREYAYAINQCDVPLERHAALQSYREKLRLWLSWIDTDEHHAIWMTIHSMVWTDVAFKTLTGFAAGNDENALNNALVVEALLNGHVATQVLAIRRLMDKRSTGIISLRMLLKDMGRDFNLFTRENYVCFDGLPYDYQAVRNAQFARLARPKPGISWAPTSGPEADLVSEMAHKHFDKLGGINPAMRQREDRLPMELLTTIEGWLVKSGADELVKWSHTYLAHAGGPQSREKIADVNVTFNKIGHAIKTLARATEAAGLLLYAGGRASALVPTPQFNQFDKLDRPIMQAGGGAAAWSRWHERSAEWDCCLDGVEDELIGRSKSESSPPQGGENA